jgi:hypothetical protein
MRKAWIAAMLLGLIVPAGVTAGMIQAQTQRDHPSSSRSSGIGAKDAVSESLTSLPLSFIENRGWIDPQVAYYVQGTTASLYFTPTGVTFRLAGDRPPTPGTSDSLADPVAPPSSPGHVLKLDFVGADPVRPVANERLPGVVSYFTGPQEDWVTGLATYREVLYPDLWPGIDLLYEGTGSSLKYTFQLDPGADPDQIRLRYRGASGLELTAGGTLQVFTPLGALTEQAPITYQQIGGQRVAVSSSYALDEPPGAYGFRLGAYDSSEDLVIDPVVVIYAGYVGGTGSDYGDGVAVDEVGNVYLAGHTSSGQGSFPVKAGPDLTHNGGADAFVAKVVASGETLAYAGYIGGADTDYALGVAVDEDGNAHVAGDTESDEDSFPVKVGPDLTYNGGNIYGDAFVAKVEASGEALAYAGYIGGGRDDFGDGVAVDEAGNTYVTGSTDSSERGFPVIVGPDLTYNGDDDAFVAKVEASGEALAYAGYIGGADLDRGRSVAVDEAGHAYVTGFTFSDEGSFPVKRGPDLTHNGFDDAFVTKVEASGEALAYAGYIGGADTDAGEDVAVDGAGNAFVAGWTFSGGRSFPVKVGPDLTQNGVSDAFIVKISSDEEPIPVCTISGTSGHDAIRGTDEGDVICAKAGYDTVSARTGDDQILGGAGHDTLVGGRGSDSLRGGTGDDVLRTADGIEGNDEAWGGPGHDMCVIDPGDEASGCDHIELMV